MTPRARIVIIAVAVVALVVAFIVASGSGDDNGDGTSAATTPATETTASPSRESSGTTTDEAPAPEPAPATPVVEVVDAKPKGGVQKLEFDKGDRIRFTVKSDTADEIHVHGYDLMKDVEAGGSVTFSFEGKIDGRFEVELEDHATQIAELEVQP